MKKVLKISAIVILVLVIFIVSAPFLFKGKIIKTIKDQANKNLNAVVDFDENIKLSLVKSFPKLYLEIHDLSIANKAPFEGDTLADIGALKVKLDLMKVIKGNIEIKSIDIENPRINAHVLNDTLNYTANWDITFPSTDTTETIDEEESEAVSMPIKHYSISNGYIVYDDELEDIYMRFNGLNLEGSGDFSEVIFDMVFKLTANQTDFKMEGIKYLSNVKTDFDAVMGMDLDLMKFTFKENTLALNNLILNFDGYVAVPTADVDMDLDVKVPSTDFKDLISLIPAIYAKDFESITAKGEMSMNAKMKGVYSETTVPAFDLNLMVKNGMFKYPDLPSDVNNVQIDLNVSNPDGELNNTLINLKQMHVELGKEPFDARLIVKNVIKDPYIDAFVKGKINLSQIKDIIELDEEISGIVKTDLTIKGYSSALEKEQYDQFYASGTVDVTGLNYFYEDYSQNIEVSEMTLDFSPKVVKLIQFDVKMGESDLKASGNLENFIPYFFDKGILKGDLFITSNYFNLNPFLVSSEEGETEASTETDTSSSELEVVPLPSNIYFSMIAEFNKLIYNNLEMNKAICNIVLEENKLTIKNLSADVFDGHLIVIGNYNTYDPLKPNFNFDLNIQGFKFKEAFDIFPVIQKYVPVAEYIDGDFGGVLNLNSDLKHNMMPDFATLLSHGKITIEDAGIKGFKPVDLIANTLDIKELKNLTLKRINPSYRIEDGRFYLKDDITFNIDKTKFTILKEGYNSLDKSLNYVIDVEMPAEKFKETGNSLVSNLAGQNIDIPIGETVKLMLNMTGTIDDPKIKTSLKDMKNNIKDNLKAKGEEELDKAKQQAEEAAKAEFEKQKAELEKKAKAEEERLKAEIEKKKKEEEARLKAELEKKKKQAEEEAKKKLKGLIK